MTTVFNRETLLKEIEKTWGSDGAHAEVYRSLLDQYNELLEKCEQCNVDSSADVLEHIGVHDATLALKAFALLKVAGYIPQDKFDMALELAVGLG